MRWTFFRHALSWIALLACAASARATVLTLDEVLESVRRHYPPLIAALQEMEVADGQVLQAEGRFDVTAHARVDTNQLGFYSDRRVDVGIEQPTAWGGASYFTGWRAGDGLFPSYDGKFLTRDLGEYRTGIRLPLFRDRVVDSRRAELQRAQLGRRIADLSIDQQRLLVRLGATRRYWEWVAAGRRYVLALAILETARARDQQLRDAVALGQLPAIEVADNNRAILARRAQAVEAERFLQMAAIELSLFYRDDQGNPVVPADDRLPPALPDPASISHLQLERDIANALNLRPEISAIGIQKHQTQVEIDLARNETLPNIDLVVGFTREFGQGPVLRGPSELRGSVVFELPFQRRVARGRLQTARARLNQLDQRERFAQDQVAAEVKDALSAVRTAYERAAVLREEVEVTRQLEDAERTRFDLGDSNLFILNLREQATFEAAVRELGALVDYQRAYASYEFSVAEALNVSGRSGP